MFYFIRKHTVIDKPAATDCFFYLHTLFCIWIDSYFYCPVYFPHLIPIYEWFQLSFMNNMFSFYHNTIQSPEQVFLFFIYKILLIIYEHLCSNLQFISLPEEVGEFLLYIMLKSISIREPLFLEKKYNRNIEKKWITRKYPFVNLTVDKYTLLTIQWMKISVHVFQEFFCTPWKISII